MGHDHGHSHASSSVKMMILAIILTLGFAAIEAIAGFFANSLALLSDAGHMGSDAIALGIAAFAAWVAQKPPSAKHSYGLGRAEVVAAWLSSLLMLIISLAVIIEAIERISTPHKVKGGVVMIVAFAGIVINLFVAWILSRGERTLNVRAALLHVMGDVLGSMAALVSGTVIYFSQWDLIDPILSIFIGILIMISSLRLLRESLLVLMEGVPSHLNLQQVKESLQSLDGVNDVHDLHIWTLSSGTTALSAHIDIHEFSQWVDVLPRIRQHLADQYHIDHITLQPEPDIVDCQPCH
jgi:cobalt-zinc-cadmium efflux system protein